MAKENKSKAGRIFLIVVLLLLAGGGWFVWDYVFKGNVNLNGEKYKYLYVHNNSDYEELKKSLIDDNLIKNVETFDFYARKMKLNENIHAGRYRIVDGMSNRQLVKMIKNGKEEKVKLAINYTTRTKQQLIEKLSSKFDMDANALTEFLENEMDLEKNFGMNATSIMTIVRPGEYELSWATSIEQFFELMKDKYKTFWTDARKKKAKEMNFSQSEIIILASVVQGEASIESEQKKIAGVYINRLSKDIMLQADPTVIFALNDFTIQRVLSNQLKFDSPYNTYMYKGLPPGPICFPTEQAIAAVLNYEKSDNLFFCAKPALNGYSDFSETLEQHEKFAKAYRDEMTRRGIKK
ncbi:MAG: endolytic transglycosylase MltG [Bacteroidia bacterium]|nr:endolytic transglycosylase MltG [Bacteroidia bacterium]